MMNATIANFTFSCRINVSNDSLTETAWIVKHSLEPDFDTAGNGYAISAIVLLLFLLGLLWNLTVICAILKKRAVMCSQPIIMLMLNLAITNLLICILVMPFIIVSGIAGEYVFGDTDLVRCQVCQTGVAVIILPWGSIHTLCLMSIDRFMYLKRPLRYGKVVTPRRMLAAIVAIWMLCIVLSIPPFFGFGEMRFSYRISTCVMSMVGSTEVAHNYFYTMLLVAEAVVPVMILFVMYTWILCIVRSAFVKKNALKTTGKGANREERKRHKNQLYLVRFFVTIFTANLITWIPIIGLVFAVGIFEAQTVPTLVFSIAYLSFLTETVVHPMIEAIHIREVRATLCEVPAFFKRKCGPREIKTLKKVTFTSSTVTTADIVV